MLYLSGIGYDTHVLVAGRKLIMGGVEIPHDTGLLGQSDADVLVHAIMDALLGAAGFPDIGGLFPNTDERYAGADSMALLTEVVAKVREAHEIVNVDSVILAEAPKMKPHIPMMKRRLAAILGTQRVNVKATTTEGMNDEGAGKCISAQAVASRRVL
ncbi:MAG: 2-C-methyl-D-erythritol 2,4-cyclodiphosphate synthase [Spirochaetia bacterium]|nr:2-C-methyl-D-erythritol 2,4-cyclodiphosphate synthase [Spirochaetia bacterium]